VLFIPGRSPVGSGLEFNPDNFGRNCDSPSGRVRVEKFKLFLKSTPHAVLTKHDNKGRIFSPLKCPVTADETGRAGKTENRAAIVD